jgi:hypothetical protein
MWILNEHVHVYSKMHLWQATFRVVILSWLSMLIIGYNHIFIGCFQVEHGYLIVFFKRTLQPIAAEIRFTVVSCHDLRYFSGFNPVLEETSKSENMACLSWLNPIMKRQITDFFAFKSCSSCLLGVFRNVFTGWSTMTMFYQNDPSRKSKVVKTAWQKVSTVTLTISVIYTINTDTTLSNLKKKEINVFCHFLEWNFLVGTVLSHDSCLSHLTKKHVLLG